MDNAREGDVLVINANSGTNRACFGDILGEPCIGRGIADVVVPRHLIGAVLYKTAPRRPPKTHAGQDFPPGALDPTALSQRCNHEENNQMTYVRFDDWSRLPGAEAEAWQSGMLLLTGTIDAATRDSAVAWLVSDATAERFLLEKANGIELRISREQFLRRRGPGSSAAGSN